MFLWHFPGSYLHWPLTSILLCGVRTFLGPCGPRLPIFLKSAPIRVTYLSSPVQRVRGLFVGPLNGVKQFLFEFLPDHQFGLSALNGCVLARVFDHTFSNALLKVDNMRLLNRLGGH